MKVAAHPLMVAVALGLVAPSALEAVEEDDRERDRTLAPLFPEDDEIRVTQPEAWEPGEAPSADEFHRVELEWLRQSK